MSSHDRSAGPAASGRLALVGLLVILLSVTAMAAAGERVRTGSSRLRDKGRLLAERFTRETLAEEYLREHGSVSQADRKPREVGDEESFFIDKTDAGKRVPIVATLRRIGRFCMVYVEKGVDLEEKQVAGIVRMFDERIYPTDTAWFGKEWSPGIDGDPRITLLLVSGLASCDGFFDPEDEYLRSKRPESNEREMLTLSVERLNNGDLQDFMGHLVAHELQHMIHWSHDPRESNWVDEGCAEFAATLFDQFPFTVGDFLAHPGRCLIDWNDTVDASNYGHVFLITDYLVNRSVRGLAARQKLVRSIVASRRASVSGLDEALRGMDVSIPFKIFYRDFCAATLLNRSAAALTGPYAYSDFVARHLEDEKKNPLHPARSFDTLKGAIKGKAGLWSSRAFSFRIPSRTAPGTQVEVSFSGAPAPGPKGRSSFDIGVAFTDSQKREAPQITWLAIRDNDVTQAVPLPAPGYDRMLVILVNHGPMKLPADEKQWPPLAFSLKVSASDGGETERTRFEELHR